MANATSNYGGDRYGATAYADFVSLVSRSDPYLPRRIYCARDAGLPRLP